MTPPDLRDDGVALLSGLTRQEPNAARTERLRRRCRAQLARRSRGPRRADERSTLVWSVLMPALVGAAGVLYAAALAATTLGLRDLFR